MWLLMIFIAVPMIEIALFIKVGGAIGLLWTLGIVFITAVIGTWLVRAQGMLAMSQLQGSFSQMRDPTEPLAHGAMILFAGALLLTPGFFTDAVGFLLLFPPFRVAAFRYLRSRVQVQSFTMGAGPGGPHQGAGQGPGRRPGQNSSDIIDGEYSEVAPEDSETLPPPH